MKLYLIRHAESVANTQKILDTALPGPPLTELGQQQAQALADRLSTARITAVYASYATRAQQTAGPLAAALATTVQAVEGVQEVGVGDLEGRGDPAAFKAYVETVRPWTQGDLTVAMPGGESGEQVRARFTTAVGELRTKHEPADADGAIALVSHGGVIRLGAEWLCDNVRPELADQGLIPNTGVVELETVPGAGWHCLSWAGQRM